MIWLLLTCSSLFAISAEAATLSGKVQLRDSREASVRKKLDYSGVVVYLEAIPASAPAPKSTHAKMIQKDKTFTPHILPISAGTTVDFPNYDPIFHNAFSNYDGQIFDVGLYPPGTTRSVRFSRTGVVRIFCNIHAHMSAVIVVLPTSLFGVTSQAGAFEIANVPPGQYRLKVFHERATSATLDSLAREITVTAESTSMPAISISESGYLPVPHKNKYGQEYPPAPADEGFYPSVRK